MDGGRSVTEVFRERIDRITGILEGLQYRLIEPQIRNESYFTGYEGPSLEEGVIFFDKGSPFLELSYTFAFSTHFAPFLSANLVEFVNVGYDYGCYLNLSSDKEIALTVLSKIYFSGLNETSLAECIADFTECVTALREMVHLETRFK
jgi:hypothetical protein